MSKVLTMHRCNSCGQRIPEWLKENELIARGCKIIGISRAEGGGWNYVYYEPIDDNKVLKVTSKI